MLLLNELKEEFEQHRVVVIVGAGVSMASTAGASTASWFGLLRSGIERAEDLADGLPGGWADSARNDLEMGRAYLPSLLAAASKVSMTLGAPNGAQFQRWLRSEIGSLGLKDRELIDAIIQLDSPILTTNYDDLLEQASGRAAISWRNPSQFQAILSGISKDIGHLHGYWKESESVVLGIDSYAKLMGDRGIDALEKAMFSIRTVLLVGFGGGLDDPNFHALRGWLRDVHSSSEIQHYRLCRNAEVEDLKAVHRDDPIVPLAYGEEHSDLANFIRQLVNSQAGSSSSSSQAVATTGPQLGVNSLQDRVKSEAILIDSVRAESAAVGDLLIPPVLLPVTHDQFIASQSLEVGVKPNRCDLSEDVKRPLLVIAGDENVGLTSALEWLAWYRQQHEQSSIPIVVDFRQLGPGLNPLRRLLVKAIREMGIPFQEDDPFPRLALTVDNVSEFPAKILARFIQELKDEGFDWIALSCRTGTEAKICDQLRAADFHPTLRYMGRLNTKDVEKLAYLVSPGQHETLASKAIRIVNTESLPRTPFTFCILLSAIVHGESILVNASGTVLLDAYVNLLLGRSDLHEDARFTLDSHERGDILAVLAERFVDANTGSLSEAEVIDTLAKYFDDVDWKEDPVEVLTSFKKRHLLATQLGQVRFTQASYLHLFSAKRAIESSAFRDRLLEKPLYYAPIITHYAALVRSDSQVLEAVGRLLWSVNETTRSESGMFAEMPAPDLPDDTDSIDELLSHLDIGVQKVRGGAEDSEAGDENDWLDRVDDKDRLPFPLDHVEDGPVLSRMTVALGLVSTVLRDSELVRNRELKKTILHRVLVVWGTLVGLLNEDDEYLAFIRSIAESFMDEKGIEVDDKEDFMEFFLEISPLLIAYGGMATTLASRKLINSLDRCFADEDFLVKPEAVVMGSMLAFGLQEPGWGQFFATARDKYPRLKAVIVVLQTMALLAYYNQTLTDRDVTNLHDFLVANQLDKLGSLDYQRRQAVKARISQRLVKNRALAAKDRLPMGETVFSTSPDGPPAEVPRLQL